MRGSIAPRRASGEPTYIPGDSSQSTGHSEHREESRALDLAAGMEHLRFLAALEMTESKRSR